MKKKAQETDWVSTYSRTLGKVKFGRGGPCKGHNLQTKFKKYKPVKSIDIPSRHVIKQN